MKNIQHEREGFIRLMTCNAMCHHSRVVIFNLGPKLMIVPCSALRRTSSFSFEHKLMRIVNTENLHLSFEGMGNDRQTSIYYTD